MKATKVSAPIIINGAVSPMALDNERIMPVIMLGRAVGKTTLRMVCQRVAPSAYEACLSESGTLRIASREIMITTGNDIKVMVKAPAKTLLPSDNHLTNSV